MINTHSINRNAINFGIAIAILYNLGFSSGCIYFNNAPGTLSKLNILTWTTN